MIMIGFGFGARLLRLAKISPDNRWRGLRGYCPPGALVARPTIEAIAPHLMAQRGMVCSGHTAAPT